MLGFCSHIGRTRVPGRLSCGPCPGTGLPLGAQPVHLQGPARKGVTWMDTEGRHLDGRGRAVSVGGAHREPLGQRASGPQTL